MTNTAPLFTWRSAVMSSDLPPTRKYVALALALYMNELGASCFPSVKRLCEKTGLSDRTIQGSVKALMDAGWLEVDPGGGDKREVSPGIWAASNAYAATFPQGYKTPERRSPPPRSTFGGSPEGRSDELSKGSLQINERDSGDFKCRHCDGLRFAGPRGLRNHLKNVHDEVPA